MSESQRDCTPHNRMSKDLVIEGNDQRMKKIFASHARLWQSFDYVYPVISRRSGGLSIGINLNIDKACNFECIYCCVDRSVPPIRKDIDLDQIRDELGQMIELATTDQIWRDPQFEHIQPEYQRINDIAFSGDGEPTAYNRFDEACRIAVEQKEQSRLSDVKIIVITNATMLDRPVVQRGLTRLDDHGGEVWAKLDAGTEEYYRLIDRTKYPFKKVLDNILLCGRQRSIVLQSLFMQVHGQPILDAQFDAYTHCVRELIESGCQIKLVQLYTTARRTAEQYVSPLTNIQLDRLHERFRDILPRVSVEVHYGVS